MRGSSTRLEKPHRDKNAANCRGAAPSSDVNKFFYAKGSPTVHWRSAIQASIAGTLFRVSQHNRKPSEPVNPPVVSNGEWDLACPRLRKRLGHFCQQAGVGLRQVVGRAKHIHRRNKRREAFDGM